MKIPIEQIEVKVDEEQVSDIEGIALSMSVSGQEKPLIVTKGGTEGKFQLIDGRRRYFAALRLEWNLIEVCYVDELPPVEKEILETEIALRTNSNNIRWDKQADMIFKLFKTKQGEKGISSPGIQYGWSLRDQAISLGISVTKVCQDLQIAKAIEANPSLREFPSRTAVLVAISRLKTASRLEDDHSKQISTIITKTFILENFLKFPLEKIYDFVLLDFPSFTIERPNLHEDTFKKLALVMKDFSQGYLFLSYEDFSKFTALLKQTGFNYDSTPYIVHYLECNANQTFMWFSKGISRPPPKVEHLIHVVKDAFISVKDKPYSLLHKLVKTTAEHSSVTNILEPFSYGGVLSRVAIHLKKNCLCLCCRPGIFENAKQKLIDWSIPYGEKSWYD